MLAAIAEADRLDVSLECQNASPRDPYAHLSVPAAWLAGRRSDLPRRGPTATHEHNAVLPAPTQSLIRGASKQPLGPVVPMDDQPGRIDDDQPGLQLRE